MSMRVRAFTLIELLVVLAILSILVAVLLPAVQTARESGRRVTCQNNLRQIGAALQLHENAQHRFPSGGWGHEWVGVPGRGSGRRQPGGWIYSLLPYLEQSALHAQGLNLSGGAADEAYSRRLATPIATFVCPSLVACQPWGIANNYPYVGSPWPYGHIAIAARSDYAINGGSSHVLGFPGPDTLQIGDQSSWWCIKRT